MAIITVSGGGDGTEERRIISKDVEFVPDEQPDFEPAVVQRVEYDNEGQMSQVTTVCGESENRRTGENLPKLTVEGIITEQQLKRARGLRAASRVVMVSDLYTGEVTIRRLTIEQTADLVSIKLEDDDVERQAFSFQIQVKQPE
jgi:hypothetical protein